MWIVVLIVVGIALIKIGIKGETNEVQTKEIRTEKSRVSVPKEDDFNSLSEKEKIEEVKKLMEVLAEDGETENWQELAALCENTGDMANAVKYYEKAGEANMVPSMVQLGMLYAMGQGIEKKYAEIS